MILKEGLFTCTDFTQESHPRAPHYTPLNVSQNGPTAGRRRKHNLCAKYDSRVSPDRKGERETERGTKRALRLRSFRFRSIALSDAAIYRRLLCFSFIRGIRGE